MKQISGSLIHWNWKHLVNLLQNPKGSVTQDVVLHTKMLSSK